MPRSGARCCCMRTSTPSTARAQNFAATYIRRWICRTCAPRSTLPTLSWTGTTRFMPFACSAPISPTSMSRTLPVRKRAQSQELFPLEKGMVTSPNCCRNWQRTEKITFCRWSRIWPMRAPASAAAARNSSCAQFARSRKSSPTSERTGAESFGIWRGRLLPEQEHRASCKVPE